MGTKNYDAIIIGAGISGLVCGSYLAKAGMKVLIVEQHDKPGGCFTSFKRKGFLFDAAAHSFGGYREEGHVRKILTEIGIDKIIKIIRFNPSDVIITPDFKISFYNNIGKTITDLIKIFPKEKDNINKFFNFIMSSNQAEFSKLKNKTFGSLLHSFFKDEKLINSLAFPVFGSGGLPPSQMHAFSGSKILSEFIIDGGYYPEGGIQNLPNAFAHIIEQNNGRILYKKLANKIYVNNNIVKGIRLDNNDIFSSKYVVSACDMTQTLKKLIGEKFIGKQMIIELRKLIPSLSTLILYLGLSKPFKGLPEPGTNIWCLPHYDLDNINNEILKSNFHKAKMFIFRVAPDKKTILAYVGAPFRSKIFWNKNKKKIAEDFLNRIDKFVPDLKKNVAYFDLATPYTIYSYTLNYQGAAFGWAKILSQTYNIIFSKTSLINGLYLTGHWTSLAFGFQGVCYSGYDTAKRILRKEKIL